MILINLLTGASLLALANSLLYVNVVQTNVRTTRYFDVPCSCQTAL